jgi:predicted methyltransferase
MNEKAQEHPMRPMRSIAAAAILSAGVSGIAAAQGSADRYIVPADAPANIRRAVESRERTAQERARDAGRKPAEIMTLAGIRAGDRVVEFASFGNYYTKMLVEAVGDRGHVYMVDMPWTDRFGGQAARAFDSAHANATYTQVDYNEMNLPSNVDVAMMVLFYHDLVQGDVDTADMNRRIFAALKPGGTFLVVDHEADSGAGWRDAATLHRIDTGVIRNEVGAAGFELAVDSDLLANPNDDHKLNMRDPAIRGNTDRAVLVFRKPD